MLSLPPTAHHDYPLKHLRKEYCQIWAQGPPRASGHLHSNKEDLEKTASHTVLLNKPVDTDLSSNISSPLPSILAFRDKKQDINSF